MQSRAAQHAHQLCGAAKKLGWGASSSPPHPPHRDIPPSRDSPPLGALGGLLSRSANRCAFQKNEKYTLSLKLWIKQPFILWSHGQCDQAGGKLKRENMRFAVITHLKRLSGLEAHTKYL